MSDPFLTGDPAGMRAFAATLNQVADRVGDVADRAAQTTSAGYEGPAAKRFRSNITMLSQRQTGAAQQLHDLAGRISRAAGQVEAAQAAERRRLEQERELKEKQSEPGARP
jgi:uncharacterized protein YukE